MKKEISYQYGTTQTPITRLVLDKLTFMQQSEGWVERSFSLSEEEQFSIHCQDFNVFMAVKNTVIEI